MKDNAVLKRVFQIIYMTFLAAAIVMLLDNVFYLPISYHVFAVIVVITFLAADVIRMYSRKKSTYIILSLVVVAAAYICLTPKNSAIIYEAAGYASSGIYDNEADRIMYNMLITVAVSFAAAIAAYLLCLFCNIRIAVSFALVIITIVLRINGHDISNIVLAAILFTFMISLSELLMIISKSRHSRAIYMTPVFLAFCVIVAVIPVSDTPLKWTKTKKVIFAVGNRAEDVWMDVVHFLKLEKYFEDSTVSGYSDGSEMLFCDSISSNDTIQLSVTGKAMKSNMYLAGTYFNKYSDSKWSSDYTEPDYPESEVGFLEYMSALIESGINYDDFDIFMRSRTMKIHNEDIDTSTAFSVNPLISTNADVETNEDNGTRRFSESQGEGYEYEISHLDIDYHSPYFEYLCKNASADIYNGQSAAMVADALSKMGTSSAFEDEIRDEERVKGYLKNREEYICNNYLELPKSVSEKVYSLAETVTESADSNYEKVRLLEKYLCDNYTYSRNPEKANEKHYVDSFLFETKEGFCMHFATAMAVMARCIGIPSRVASGYSVHYQGDSDESVIHYIQGSAAHSWAEVYVFGVGWVRCEATPHYAQDSNSAWTKTGELEYRYIAEQGRPCPQNIVKQDKESGDTGKEEETPAAESAAPKSGNEAYEQEDSEMTESETKGMGVKEKIICGIILSAAAIGITAVAIMLLFRYRRRRRYRLADNGQKCGILIDEILAVMKKRGFGMDESVTLSEFASRNDIIFADDYEAFIELIDAYQGYMFGSRGVSSETVARAEELAERIHLVLEIDKQ